MVQIRTAEVERFLGAPDSRTPVVLLYGADPGLVAERADTLAAAVVRSSDPFAVVRLDAETIASDPGRLSDEARAPSLFGGTRAIRVAATGNRPILPALEPLLDDPPRDCWVILQAGELRKSAPLRRRCESARTAAVIACYPDQERDLARLVDRELTTGGLTIAPQARSLLLGLLGADRLMTRQELAKLVTYAAGTGRISVEDVGAVIGDASAFDADDLVDAVAAGRPADVQRLYQRLVAAGSSPSTLAGAVLRHFQALHRAGAAIDRGDSVAGAIARLVPPIFVTRQPAFEAAARLWTVSAAERALDRLADALLAARRQGALERVILGQALLAVAAQGAGLARGRRAQSQDV